MNLIRKLVIITIMTVCTIGAKAQLLTLFNVDTSAFPVMKAKFYAIDAAGKQIKSFAPADFKLTENGTDRTVLSVSCPPDKAPQRLSSVIVIDVSGSMVGAPLDIAKMVGKTWVNALPLGQSDCSVVSFDDNNYFNQDFTTNRNKLLSSIDAVGHGGGTDYNFAMIEPLAGGILVAKTAKHKKVIIFITDGQPNQNPDEARIIAEAKANGITIYCITINLPAHSSMKHFADQTAGLWFENVKTEAEAKDIAVKILARALYDTPCDISWLSDVSCQSGIINLKLLLTQPSLSISTESTYISPSASEAKLEFNPSSLKILNPTPGIKRDTTINVTAKNSDFTIKNITSSNPAFSISPNNFTINSGETKSLKISYFPADSGYNYTKFDFINDKCPIVYYVSGGWKGKKPSIRTIKLISPNGGEVFIGGTDTVITWEGVPPDEPVTLEYRIADSAPWVKLTDIAKGLKYKFHVPRIESDYFLARVTAKAFSNTYGDDLVLIPAGSFQMGNTGTYNGEPDEKIVHTVTISYAFLMSKCEIIQKDYASIMGSNPSSNKGDSLPVESCTWYEAVDYCNKRSINEGLQPCYSGSGPSIVCDFSADGYRLPTEAEWEYACKAGTTSDTYWGNINYGDCSPIDPVLDKIAWYCGNAGRSQIVGKKRPNTFGLYDILGNVHEWCWDIYESYTSKPVTDPRGAKTGSDRLLRDGSFNYYGMHCRASNRSPFPPSSKDASFGFRVVRNF